MGKARHCRGKVEDADEQLEVAQVTANKVRVDAKMAKKEVLKFEVDYVVEVGCKRDKVESTKQLRQQSVSAAARTKELAAIHTELESQMAKANFLDDALKVSRKEVAAVKGVVKEQRAWLDVAGARMAELMDRWVEASASTATCCKKLLPVQENLATALEKVKVNLARVVAMAKERDAVTAKYEKLCTGMGRLWVSPTPKGLA